MNINTSTWYARRQMKKLDLAREVARRTSAKPANVADQLDRAVNHIVQTLRRGEIARLPGLGTIKPGKHWTFSPERRG